VSEEDPRKSDQPIEPPRIPPSGPLETAKPKPKNPNPNYPDQELSEEALEEMKASEAAQNEAAEKNRKAADKTDTKHASEK